MSGGINVKFKKIAVPVSIAMLSVMMFGCGAKKDNDTDADTKTNVEQKSETDEKKVDSETDKGVAEQKTEEQTEEEKAQQQKVDEAAEKEAAESVLPAEINQEEVKSSIIEGKQVLFDILTSRDPDKIDLDNERTGVIERFNSMDKLKAELSPYFSERYIEDFLVNILEAKEESGELYIALGDLGMWAEYPQLEITNTTESGERLIVDYVAPSSFGDINHKAEMLYLDGKWKMDKESNS